MKPKMKLYSRPEVSEGSHLIGAYSGDAAGPTLIAVGSIHGNEPAGLKALLQISEQLPKLEHRLRGRVYLIAGNTRAYNKDVRYIDRDLNRAWTRNNLGVLGMRRLPDVSECRELSEINALFDSILITARSEVYVLDLHSTSAEGIPFATVGDTLRNRGFAMQFPVTILLGIEEQLEGTMLEYLNNTGAVTMGFEGGSHYSEETIENHAALTWLAMVNSGILAESDLPDLTEKRDQLARGGPAPKIVEIRHREAITTGDGFEMLPGFNNFDPVAKGQILASKHDALVRAAESGLILMPLYQKLGEDGFFLGRTVAPFWLRLSEILRRLKVQELMPWLPGVKRDPNDHETLMVNTRMARFFPLQIFHLLGYRKRRWHGTDLVVSRRRYDTESPFLALGDL